MGMTKRGLGMAAVLAALLFAQGATALQSLETWISGTGSDGGGSPNNCANQQTPCRTIAAGVTQTTSGGTLHVGPGSYDYLDIRQSITVVLDQQAHLDGADSGFSNCYSAILIHADSAAIVNIKGGLVQKFGDCGISIEVAKSVTIEDMTVTGASSGGIVITPFAGRISVMNRVTMTGNLFGVKADGSQQAGSILDVEVRDSVAARNTNNGYIATSNTGQAEVRFKITNSSADGNGSYGAVATGAQAFMIIDRASLTGNGTGLAQLNGATIGSYGNNGVNFNTTNIVGTITTVAQH